MICFEEAFDMIVNEFKTLEHRTEKIDLINSIGRISAKDYFSDIPFPQFNNSSMDGIAIRHSNGNSEWKLAGEISAGNYKNFPADDNSAVYITTGAMLPSHYDTVIPVEDIELNETYAKLKDGVKIKKGQFVRMQGEAMLSGSMILGKNITITAQHTPLLAVCGFSTLEVLAKPLASVVSTGDELIDIDEVPEGDKIRCSNLYSVFAAASRHFECLNAGIIKDDKNAVRSKLAELISSDSQLIITTGGVSVGKYDYLPEVLREFGAEIIFSGVNIKPGKPMTFAVYNKDGITKLVFGLPGNPVSSFITFMLFVSMTYIYARTSAGIESSSAFLTENIKKRDGKKHFLRGILRSENGRRLVSLAGKQSSDDLYGLSLSNCIIVIEEDMIDPKEGDVLECIMI